MGPLILKAASPNWNAPPLQSEDGEWKTHCLNHMVVTEVPLWNVSLAAFFEFHLHVLHKQQKQEEKKQCLPNCPDLTFVFL